MAVFVYKRVPAFADTDAAGMVHFSRLAQYVEEAEHAFLEQAGHPIDLRSPDALYWPRVAFNAEYLAPVPPLREIEVVLKAIRPGRSSLTFDWEIRAGGSVAAKGTMKTVCCRKTDGGLKPAELPKNMAAGL
jgi:4-hydroxybenzoyl-CoA thioesterase/acyl-CoA thioester hydrolase